MKKLLALMLLAAFTLGACQKDETVKPQFELDSGDKKDLSTYD
ncbi:MAG TPA: hypothetical protein VGD22_12120 [Sphingobacteriaceae bacterium]